MDAPCPDPPFASLTELAEVATAGVLFNLEAGDHLAAEALQPVARAAWAAVADRAGTGELVRAARRAQGALAMSCGMAGERRFLADVLAYLAADTDRVWNRRRGCS